MKILSKQITFVIKNVLFLLRLALLSLFVVSVNDCLDEEGGRVKQRGAVSQSCGTRAQISAGIFHRNGNDPSTHISDFKQIQLS